VGFLKALCDYDWPGAEQEFKRALELSPSSADAYDLYGRVCASLERYDEALTHVKRAHELDPLAHRTDVVTTLLRAGRFSDALQAATGAVEFDPYYDRGHATLGWAYIMNGMHDEGMAEIEKAIALSPGSTVWLAQLGQAHAMAGNLEKARDVLRQLEALSQQRYVSPYHFAYVYTGLGEQDAAMDWLERAYEQRAGATYGIKGSFLFTTLRSHPRFRALLQKMNLD